MTSPDNEKNVYEQLIWALNKYITDMRRNMALLVSCLVIFIGILVYINYKKSSVYKASFTVTYEDLTRKVYGDRLSKLNSLLENNRAKAGALLNTSDGALKSLRKIEGKNILGEKLSEDLNTDRIPFVVSMYITDTAYVDELQSNILQFLESGNEYLSEKRQMKMNEYEQELKFINKQLSMMDSLKTVYNNEESTSSKKSSSADGGTTLYELSYTLYKRKQELNEKLTMPKNLYVIDDAIVTNQSHKSYIVMTLLGLIIGLVVYTILAYIVVPAVRYKG